MELSTEELQAIVTAAVTAALSAKQTKVSTEVPEMKAEDIIKPLSPLEDISEEELMYWATPYYDELQAMKRTK